MSELNIERLINRIDILGETGKDSNGERTRLAVTDEDKQARDLLVEWMREEGLKIRVDRIGNIFGIWQTPENEGRTPVMTGSHIDTVINAGKYDGCLGVLAALEVISTLKARNFRPKRPVVMAAFTNEEGVRYSPDMMGSLVYAGGMSADEALSQIGTDGAVLGDELKRTGYAGEADAPFIRPCAFVELHIEQGPILEAEGIRIGAVSNLQGICWERITVEGQSNHAGTTPLAFRRDAGLAAAKINVFLRELAAKSGGVATVGTIAFEPNAVNVIPSKAVFTADLRNPDKEKLSADKQALSAYLKELEAADGVKISSEILSGFDPVLFDEGIVLKIEKAAQKLGLSSRRITSGAGQDAQMLARICPSAMIFIPSAGGISHSPDEYSSPQAIEDGAEVLLEVTADLAGREA